MKQDLADFLARHTPLDEKDDVWGNGTVPLCITSHLGNELPPLRYVTSVRSIVFRDDSVIVLRNRDGTHAMPGGRREPNESLSETLHREVLEETGWTISIGPVLGFIRFHHLKDQGPSYPYPHPDFLQVIYVSEALDHKPEYKLADDYELDSEFRSIAEVLAENIDPGRNLLNAAIRLRHGL